jgi:PII-like signaling protein
METLLNPKLLRIFVGENDKAGHQPLFEVIVLTAKKMKLSGATVIKGIMGYGANSVVHTSKLFEISSDLPMIIEIADTEEKVRDFSKVVEDLFEQSNSGGLITIEDVEVIRYRPSKKS